MEKIKSRVTQLQKTPLDAISEHEVMMVLGCPLQRALRLLSKMAQASPLIQNGTGLDIRLDSARVIFYCLHVFFF